MDFIKIKKDKIPVHKGCWSHVAGGPYGEDPAGATGAWAVGADGAPASPPATRAPLSAPPVPVWARDHLRHCSS